MKDTGFIILYRSLLEWEWYNDINTSRLFLHCLLKANYKTKNWRGITIERGTFVTSTQTLAEETGLTNRQIRTSLSKLVTTGEVTIKTTTKNSTITINNYDLYQTSDKQNVTQTTSKATNKRQATDKPATTTNKSNKETKKQVIKEYGTHIRMEENEYEKLVERFGKNLADRYIEKVDLYIGSTGKRYKSYYMTVISWINKDMEKDPKMKYAWQEELKAEQEVHDAKVYEPKRDKKEVEDLFNKL